MNIKVTKIDKMVILVIGDEILQRTLTQEENEGDFFEELMKDIDKLRSGLVTDPEQYAKILKDIRFNISPKRMLEKQQREEAEKRISEETMELAKGGLNEEDLKGNALRITSIDSRFEHDIHGLVYLKGHSVPMPQDLVQAIIKSSYEKEPLYTVDSLLNFWNWAVLNPNPEARNDLFGWFRTGDFSITDDGMIVAYRCVDIKKHAVSISSKLKEVVISEYNKARGSKKNPARYGIFQNEDGSFKRFVEKTHEGYLSEKGYKGNLSELYEQLVDEESESVDETVFTDNYTHRMEIRIGKEVTMPRKECNEDRNASCSSGLHFMSKKYSLRLGKVKLIILINPMNVVAFPAYDNTKGRCCAYMPVAQADIDENGDIQTLGNGSFDFRYGDFSKNKLEEIILNGGFEKLVEDGEISSEVTKQDFSFIRDFAAESISKKVDYVE